MAMRALRAAAALSLGVGVATSCGGRRNLLSDLPLDLPSAGTAHPNLPLNLPLDIPFGAARIPYRLSARLRPSVLSGATENRRNVCGRPRVGTLGDRLPAATAEDRSATRDPEARADDLRSARDVNGSTLAYCQ